MPAQAQVYSEGSHVVSLGYGAPSLLSVGFNLFTTRINYTESNLGPIYLKYEYMASDVVAVGFQMAYARTDIEYDIDYLDRNNQVASGREGCTITNFAFYSDVNFYWLRRGRIAMYSGIGIGYNNVNYSEFSDDPNSNLTNSNELTGNAVPIGAQLTAIAIKADFVKGLGAYASFGVGKSLFEIGLCYGLGGKEGINN